MAKLKGSERAIAVTALRHAIPYLRMFKDKVFVVKAGGSAFESDDSTRSLVEQLGVLHQLAIRIVLVHGGGPQQNELAAQLGLQTRFVDGRRVTDGDALRVASMVLSGQINARILAACRELEVPAVGISGVDAGLVRANRRPPVTRSGGDPATVDYGFVGDIRRIEPAVIEKQLDSGFVPVVSPLSADDAGVLLNINADTVAAEIACALGAEKLILATGAPGILENVADPRSLISYIDRAGLAKMRDEGLLSDGMLPKVASMELALAGGVPRVHVISYASPDSLLLEIFTNEGTGTLVVDDINQLRPAEQTA